MHVFGVLMSLFSLSSYLCPEFAPNARRAALSGKGGIVQFDILPKNINKTVAVDIAVDGDVTQNLRHLVPLVQFRQREPWFQQLNAWKEKYPFMYTMAEEGAPLKPQTVLEELNRQTAHMKDKVIITTGVGQHQMWAAQYYRWEAREKGERIEDLLFIFELNSPTRQSAFILDGHILAPGFRRVVLEPWDSASPLPLAPKWPTQTKL